jgi:lipoyl-dependent peroxiredoxin
MKSHSREASVRWSAAGRRAQAPGAEPRPNLRRVPGTKAGNSKQRTVDPLELIAAAHAGSFASTLADQLRAAGYQPRQIDTTVTVLLEHVAKQWRMTQIHLDITARVPGAAECDFVDAALQAKESCPVSQALNANISMRAKLTRNE